MNSRHLQITGHGFHAAVPTAYPPHSFVGAGHSNAINQQTPLIPQSEPFWHQLKTRPRRSVQMVEIYNGDYSEVNYVRKVPIQLLVRFSISAAEAFPKSANSPGEVAQAPAYDFAAQYPHAKIFELRIHAPEQPTNNAILTALKWMFDFRVVSEQPPPDFGPSQEDFKKPDMNLTHLLDLWQANLAFQLRPYAATHNLKREIFRRVTVRAPTLDVFMKLAAWIPVDDSVMTRCITSHHDWIRASIYSEQEIQDIKSFIQTRPDLESRVTEIFTYQAQKPWRTNSKLGKTKVNDHSNTHVTTATERGDEIGKVEVAGTSTNAAKPHRRARRRRQQSTMQIEADKEATS